MTAKPKDTPTKGETTRIAIEDAAVELFMEKGYHATSMRQIAERAELALGGIYNHFKSKDEIFEAIIIDKHPYKRVLPAVLEAQGETAEEFLRSAAIISLNELKREPYYFNLLFIEFVEFNGRHGAALLREVAPRVLPIFEKLIKSRKELRLTNPAMLVRTFFGMLISYMITERVVENSAFELLLPKSSMDVYIDLYLHGVIKESS
jgi:AcrR family transcriptional regulator